MAIVCAKVLLSTFCQILNFFPVVFAFNLDTDIPIVKIGNRDSYFGFSVAQHFVRNEYRGTHDPWILVGAPRENITHYTAPQSVRDTVRPGAVYKCGLTSLPTDCDVVRIDQGEVQGQGSNKSDQWLGVSVASQGTGNGKAVACAHRYKRTVVLARLGQGVCISMTNSLEEDEYWEPCNGKPVDKGHGQYGICQAGASTAISKDGDLLIGAPGPYHWRGAVFKNILHANLTQEPRWLMSAAEDLIPNVPGPEPTNEYYSYLGFSVKVGNIINGRKTYVAGAPRSKDFGQVLLFESTRDYLKVEPRHYLTGDNFGSCFGYDIAIGDFNSDGKDDLVVGAPFYHEPGVGGAIYVYLNGPQGITKDSKPLRITSRKMKDADCVKFNCLDARFGFVVSRIGDVNRDGYEDLAVGAPYEEHGAVYIFHGSPMGIKKDYSQRIHASDLPSADPLTTFGYSLSGGDDLDSNGYPDLVVGAYAADRIVILRSRPIINVKATFDSTPSKIDPNTKICYKDNRRNNCFELRICFEYSAEPKERFAGPVELEYEIEAEKFTGAQLVRVFFKGIPEDNGYIMKRRSVLRSQNSVQCVNHIVYVKNNSQDFLNAIQLRLTYKLKDVPPPNMVPGHPLPDINTYPVLDSAAAEIPLAVNFIKNCVHDTECLSNLNVSASLDLDKDTSGDYVLRIGQTDELKLNVIVGNSEEEAHESMLYVTLPLSLSYVGLDERGKKYSCTWMDSVVACVVGNPLHSGQQAKFGIRLDPNRVPSTLQKLNISLLVNTTSKETNLLNDVAVVKVTVIVEADLEVRWKSTPSEVFFSGDVLGEDAVKNEEQIGSEIIHSYEVKHLSGGRVVNSSLLISWPYEKESGEPQGKHLLYLMDPPSVEGPVTCYPGDKVNRRKVGLSGSRILKTGRLLTPEVDRAREKRHTKSKRSRDDVETEKLPDGRIVTVVRLDCDRKSAKCFEMNCDIGQLSAGESIVVHLRFRLWHGTFLEDYTDVGRVLLSSKAEIRIDRSLNIRERNTRNDVNRAVTIVQPSQEVQAVPEVELWIIIVSVCIGLILLILLIVLLWKCGFFERKKPEEMAEHKAKLETQKNYPEYPD